MSDDFEKLKEALSILHKFTTVDDFLKAAGLANIPTAQLYGIIGGICTFAITITSVGALLLFGGSFQRIAEQGRDGDMVVQDPTVARLRRALILEELLSKRDFMVDEAEAEVESESPDESRLHPLRDKFSALARRVMSSPPPKKVGDYMGREYEANYVAAYRRCQDKPGGAVLSGQPEARFEAYARSYAGCGVYTDKAYRRSYGRMYEALACKDHKNDKRFARLFEERPYDIVGKNVRLEPLTKEEHARKFFEITCGDAEGENRSYDPNEVWGFLSYGPFLNVGDLEKSPIFAKQNYCAGFAIVSMTTDKLLGIISLTKDEPENLKVQLEHPIMKPVCNGTSEQIESCFLLIDRLFALGYRRIQLSLDSQDSVAKKLPGRLGFTLEGLLQKDMIVKDANRDSLIYGLLNSDWKKGARVALFKNLHGASALKVDTDNLAREEEMDERQRVVSANESDVQDSLSKKNN